MYCNVQNDNLISIQFYIYFIVWIGRFPHIDVYTSMSFRTMASDFPTWISWVKFPEVTVISIFRFPPKMAPYSDIACRPRTVSWKYKRSCQYNKHINLQIVIFKKKYNYNCLYIYWTLLIWLVKNGHLIAFTCISFFDEPGPFLWGLFSWGTGPFTTELLLWYCAMLLWREMDSRQLPTLYLTLSSTHMFSGGKAKNNLHTTPKLTVVMPINCLLRSIQLPVPKMMQIPLAPLLVFVQLRWMFSVEPRNKIVSCCLVYPTFCLQFVFAFFNHSIKIAQFLFAGGHFFSFLSHFDRWRFSLPL